EFGSVNPDFDYLFDVRRPYRKYPPCRVKTCDMPQERSTVVPFIHPIITRRSRSIFLSFRISPLSVNGYSRVVHGMTCMTDEEMSQQLDLFDNWLHNFEADLPGQF